ncbi:hypothetical protein K458DRAFT_389804 [Lentithecium fluviatile CBS 122367]|uniref:Rhodopsin domain-containing protein n=1 Tax=Lentithecium fluviatile CBS 122367 TaxID=1168545 RepID=A0A6G1J0Y9_9PLEO|nr:hypothetical protein K458DRAFT_389804 [Lentithecium fluviatile CBS 122367]
MADNQIGDKSLPGDVQARQDVAIGVSIAATLIGMTFIALRVYTRAFIVRNMGPEDWTMLSAAILTIVFLVQFIVSIKAYGVGWHTISVSPQQAVAGTQLGLAVIVVYKGIVTLIKMSILMIYLRLAVNKTFERLCKGTIYLLAAYQFIVIIIVPAQCTPLSKLWDFTGTVPGHCINTNVFYYITSTFHIIIDIWILLLPYKLILSIPRPLRERLGVYAVFGLGVLGTICAIVRFNYLVAVTKSMDPFYDSIAINIWSVIEVNVGILCASLPTLRPLFSQAQRNRTREALNLGPRKSERSSKSIKSSKRGALIQTKEMFITITAGTWKGGEKTTYDEEFELLKEEMPPPVPPKDEKFSPLPKIAYPDMTYRKL